MQTKAAVLYEQGRARPYAQSQPLAIEVVDLDDPRDGELLVEIAAAGLCHSDLSTIEGIRPRPVPLVMGHEAAGIVRAVGSDVDDVKVGDPDCVAKVREATGGGVDYVFEMAGNIEAWRTAYAIVGRGGTLTSAGLTPAVAEFAFKPYDLVSDEKAIKGSYMGSSVPQRDVPRFLELYKQGKLPVDKLRSGFLALEDINAGFDRLADGIVVRQILRFSE